MTPTSFVFHPFLFGIYPILFLFAQNIDALRVSSLLRPLGLTVIAVAILFILLRILVKDTKKAALMCTILVMLTFSYQPIYNLLQDVGIRHRFLLPGIGILGVLGMATVMRMKAALNRLTTFSHVMALALILMSLFHIAQFQLGWSHSELLAQERLNQEQADQARISPPLKVLPDIYYIILDAYTRADILKDIYGFDNAPFLNFLKQKGFYIANQSTSNYAHTLVSLASSLNYQYINFLPAQVGETSTNRSPLKEMIENNRIHRFLRQFNYSFIHFASGAETTQYNRYADIVLRPPRDITEFEKTLVYFTPFPAIQDLLVRHDVLDQGTFGLWNFEEWRERILFITNTLGHLPETDGPRFVIAHILDPHPPFVFNQKGGRVIQEDLAEAYVEEIMFLNRKIRGVVTEILSTSKNDPIIIIQGDHGFLPWDRTLSEQATYQSTFSILNAYYLPGSGQDLLYPTISPVNSFRTIFNHYFGKTYDLLADKNYFSTVQHPYQLTDRTKDINQWQRTQPTASQQFVQELQ